MTIARSETVSLAHHILKLDTVLKANDRQLADLVKINEVAPLLEEKGFGPVTPATCLTAWSHAGRVRSEAGYAALAGVNPIPASSRNTVRKRLNGRGYRVLNRALHLVSLNRMTTDPETCEYVNRRKTEGRTDRETRCCIKRNLARHVYRASVACGRLSGKTYGIWYGIVTTIG